MADLQRRVTQLEQIVASLCEQLAEEADDAPEPVRDLAGNAYPSREPRPGESLDG